MRVRRRPRRPRRPRARPASLAQVALPVALVSTSLVVGVSGTSYAIDGDDCESITQVDTGTLAEVTQFDGEGSPAQALDLDAAQRRVRDLSGRTAGAGVTVAVLDSGVQVDPLLLPSVVAGAPVPGATATKDLVYYQGTLLAGGIAAAPEPGADLPVGIAPAATIYDQRIYDIGPGTSNDELFAPGPDSVAQGLEAIAPLVGPDGISIVTVAVVSGDSARLRAAVDRVTDRGAIIVAATAPPPDEDSGAPPATSRDGEDLSWPAGYSRENPLVVAGTTTGASGTGEELDAAEFTLYSSAIDVAAPTAGLVSVGLNGAYCSIAQPSTAVAAAVVSGVLALLATAFPDESPEQLIARLEATASGPSTTYPALPDTREGRGVVQPLEALTRPLAPSRSGELPIGSEPEQQVAPAVLPVPEPDVLASTRDDAVWWGLLGGGVLVVLVLLRPVLSRRRAA